MTAGLSYATREEWLNAFITYARPVFAAQGAPIPFNTRVSVGFPSTGYRSNTIGECWSDMASADGHFEIFLNPTNETESRICDILTHELCHAALGLEAKHGKLFKALATGLGLEGKMTATVAGQKWMDWALPILEQLGPMPYGALRTGAKMPRKKKKTYGVKLECDFCGWLSRASDTHITPHIEEHGHLNCPVPGCDGVLQIG
jgi:hypothetical protein